MHVNPFDLAHIANSDPRVVREQAENARRFLPIDATDYSWPEERVTVRSVLRGKFWPMVGALSLGLVVLTVLWALYVMGGR